MHIKCLLTVLATVLLVQAESNAKNNQTIKDLKVLDILVFDKKNCPKLKLFSFNILTILQDQQFIYFAKQDSMDNLQQRFQYKIDEKIQEEQRQLHLYFEHIKGSMINDFQQNQEHIKNLIIQKSIKDLNQLFFEDIQSQQTKLNTEFYFKEIEFLKANNSNQDLIEQVFENQDNNKHSREFYLYQDNTKQQIIQKIYQDETSKKMVNENWEQGKDQYTHSLSFINKKSKFEKNTTEDYLEFVDYYTINNKDEDLKQQGEYLFLDTKYQNFKIFDILFKDYQERDFEFYIIIYKYILKYRAQNLDQELSLLQFCNFLEQNMLQQDYKNYHAIKIFLYYKLEINYVNIQPEFNKNIEASSEPVIRLIEDRDDIRKMAVKLNKEFNLKLKINTFENQINKKDGQELDEIINKYIKKKVEQNQGEINDEILEFIKNSNSSRVIEVKQKKNRVIRSVIKYSVETYIDATKKNIGNYDKYQQVIDQVLQQNSEIGNLEFLKIILKELSDQENDYLIYLEKIRNFFNHKYFKILVVQQTSEFQENLDSIKYCTELQMDIDMIGVDLQACSQLQIQQRKKFSENYLLNFVKLMSFIRIFDYYDNDDDFIVFYFVKIYKFIVLNKSQYSFDQEVSIVQKFDQSIDNYLISQKKGEQIIENSQRYFENIDLVHDILKILNLRNYIFSQDKTLVYQINFPYTVFEKIETLLNFQKNTKIQKQLNKLLEEIRQRFCDKSEFYAFNLLFLIMKSHEINLSMIDQEEKYFKILQVTDQTNNFDIANKSNYYLKTSRDLALFYYLEYLNYQKKQESKIIVHRVFIEDIKRLSFNEKLYLFGHKMFNMLKPNTDFDKLQSKQFDEKLLEQQTFQAHVAKKFTLFKQIDLYKGSLVQSLSAYEYLSLLIKNDNYEKIQQENLFDEIQHNPVQLFSLSANQQKDYTIRFKKMANQWLKSDQNYSENVFLFNYYLLAKFLSQDRFDQKSRQIGEKIHLFINSYFHNKIQGTQIDQEDQLINSENLYFISQLIFSYALNDIKFETNNEVKRNEINTKTAALWLHYNNEAHSQLLKLKDENFKLSLSQLSHVIPELTINHSLTHKHLNFLEETFRGIFEQRCRYEQFDFILNHCDYKENEYILLKTIKYCSSEENTQILNNYVYQMLKAIYDSLHSRFLEQKQSYLVHQNLLQNLNETSISRLSNKQLFQNLKRIFSTNHQVNYTKSFAEFLQQIWTNFSFDEIQKLIDQQITSQTIGNDLKKEFQQIMFIDTFLFAEFDDEKSLQNLMLHKLDFLPLMLQKLKYTSFLTRILSQGDFTSKENIEKYFNIYTTIIKIRIEKIQGDVLDKSKIDQLKLEILDMPNVLNPKQKQYQKANTAIYFAHIFFQFYVEEFVRNLDNLKGRAYKCALINIAQQLLDQNQNLQISLDVNEANKYLQINSEIKNNFQYFYKEIQKIIKMKKLPNEQQCVSNEREILQEYTNFYKLISKNENISAKNFELGIKEATLSIDKESEFNEKKNLFI